MHAFDIDPTAAGFDPERLLRISEHLRRNFVGPGKIAGCQTLVARHGIVAHFESLGFADVESGGISQAPLPVSTEGAHRLTVLSGTCHGVSSPIRTRSPLATH